jgi:hypothetical protein
LASSLIPREITAIVAAKPLDEPSGSWSTIDVPDRLPDSSNPLSDDRPDPPDYLSDDRPDPPDYLSEDLSDSLTIVAPRTFPKMRLVIAIDYGTEFTSQQSSSPSCDAS